MVRLWSLYRGGGMGVGHLPETGGAGDQAAIMIDAFGVMEAMAAKLPQRER